MGTRVLCSIIQSGCRLDAIWLDAVNESSKSFASFSTLVLFSNRQMQPPDPLFRQNHFRARRDAHAVPARLRVVPLALMVAAVVGVGSAFAQTAHVRLGSPEVYSTLGSPLWVKIPIEATEPGEDVSTTRFTLGARPLNASVPFVESGEIGFERLGNKYFLVIRSRGPVDEPAVGVVVREQLPNGVRSREFFLLLDPPLASSRASTQSTSASPADSNVAAPQTVETISLPRIPVPAQVATPATPRQTAGTSTPDTAPPKARRSKRVTDQAPQPVAKARAPTAPVARAPRSAPQEALAPRPKRAVTGDRKPGSSPVLKLSFGEGMSERATASDTERADLRARQLLLDVDDLTSALLARQHKISQLEKELGELSLRVSAAERQIASNSAGTKPPPPAGTPVAEVQPVTPPATAPASSTAPVVKPVAEKPVPGRSYSLLNWLLLGAGVMVGIGMLMWTRRYIRHRTELSNRLVIQAADEYVDEVLAPARTERVETASAPEVAVLSKTPVARDQPAREPAGVFPVPAGEKPAGQPEIEFELPEFISAAPAAGTKVVLPTTSTGKQDSAKTGIKAPEDMRSRRMRYLQSRYQDIAILMPPLDAPQRLLSQAGTVYAEGATDFVKRLLKYSAYSRPYAEEFWLALLELLYREKFANDYVVNAKWFHQYHPESSKWDEVMRIGYLLDPAESLFAPAKHWSHEGPEPGIWLPVAESTNLPNVSLPHLQLELAS